jgi:hypothetical protein
MTEDDFIRQWFTGCQGVVEITLLEDQHKDDDDRRRRPITVWLNTPALNEEQIAWLRCKNEQGYGVSVGAATRKARKEHGRGGKADVYELPGIWCDLDHGATQIHEAATQLGIFKPYPTFIVATGGGVHGWWKFVEPITTPDAATWENAMRGIAHCLQGDTSVADVSRIMRLPGFRNKKPDRADFLARFITWEQDEIGGTGQPVDAHVFVPFVGLGAPPPKRWVAPPRPSNGKRPRLTDRAESFLKNGDVPGNRHSSLIHTAYSMRDNGFPQAECFAEAGSAGTACGLPEKEVEGVIEYVYNK